MRKLSAKWVDVLIRTPETGMGYHVINITTKNGKLFRRIVLDCELLTEDIYDCYKQPIKDDDIINIVRS